MPRKGENIYKRKDGRWEGRYIKERTPSRKILYGYVYGRRYTDVKEKLTLLKAKQLHVPIGPRGTGDTYEVFLYQWLTEKVRRRVKPTTYSHYVRLIKRHIVPSLGGYPLQDIQEAQIQNYIYSLSDQQLSSGTVRIIFALIRQSMDFAVKQELLLRNPCYEVELPRLNPRVVRALSIDEQRRLETAALTDLGCSPIILALYSGLRIGEISGLKWTDIDFDNRWIRVTRTISRIIDETSLHAKTQVVSGTPKTAESSRIIPLADNLKDYLLDKRSHAVGEYVITSRKGFAEPRVINYRLKKTLQQAGLESAGIRFHSLRHTFATRCLEQGVDIASLSKLLGHRSTKMTLDTYADSVLEHRKAAMEAVDKLLEKKYPVHQ